MNPQDLLAQRRVHTGEAVNERFRPGPSKKDLAAKV